MNTDGSSVVGGSVITGGGDFIGRDQIFGYSFEQVTVLIEQIRRIDQPSVWDGRIPYPGLAAFTEHTAELFFGREALIGELLTRVSQARFIAVAGPSGSGKSSLVRAGLIYGLKQGKLPGSQGWLYESLTPRGKPLEQLAQALAALAITIGKSPRVGDELRARAYSNPAALHELVNLLARESPDQRVIIFIDQFEELFAQTRNEDECHAFLELLLTAATAGEGRVTVLIALRVDFILQCVAYPRLRTLLNQQLQLVGAMEPTELGRSILLPALETGVEVEPRLAAQIITDMWGEPGALPLMQFALADLFNAAQPVKGQPVILTQHAYLTRGGVNEALARHANAVLTQLTPAQQGYARLIFMQLVTPSQGAQDTRRTASLKEVLAVGSNPKQVNEVFQLLLMARLITTSQVQNAAPVNEVVVTIAHEKLIAAWPWLKRLVDEQRELIKLQNDIADDAKQWVADNRDSSYLYRGARLAHVYKQMAISQLSLTGVASEFVQVALQVAYAERRKRRQVLLGSLTGLLIACYLVFAWWRGWTPFLRWQPVLYTASASTSQVALQAIASNGNQYYLASKDYGVKRYSPEQGWSAWEAQGLPRGQSGKVGDPTANVITLVDIAVAPENAEQVYVVADDTLQIRNQIYRSQDGGSTWAISGDRTITSTQLAQMPLATGQGFVLFAAKASGLWGSKDAGQHWQQISGKNGLPAGVVNAVAVSPDGKPYVGMFGLYRGEGAFPWHWAKVGNLEHAVLYIAFGTAGQLYLALGTDAEHALAVGCYQANGELDGKRIENFGQFTVLTALINLPTQDDTYLYGDSTGKTVEAHCDGRTRFLGSTSNTLFQGVGDLALIGAPGAYRLWQVNESGLFEYQIQ